MTHIMHIIESLEFGGAEKVVVHLANKLSSDYKVSICLTKRSGELTKEVNDNIQVHCLNSPDRNDFSLPSQIRTLLIENKVDILHSHNWGVYLESALALRKVRYTKLVHTVHGPYMNYAPGIKSALKIKLRHMAEKHVSKYVYKIVAVSRSIEDYIKKDIKIKKSKIEIIHNGITDISEGVSRNVSDIVRFVTVGRLAKIKNQKMLLEAFSLVGSEHRNFHLTFAGDGPEMQPLVHYCKKLGLEDNVSFLGFRTDVKDVLSNNDVFLLSSDYEGISIALLESMSLSMPAIATNVGGIPDTIKNDQTGFLVPLGDVNMYSNKISEFVKNSELVKTMGMNARQFFLEEFHEDVVLNGYRSLYERCVSSNQ